MNELLARCESPSCMHVFSIPSPAGGNEASSIQDITFVIEEQSETVCPICKKLAPISAGTYRYFKGDVFLVDGPPLTKRLLQDVKHELPVNEKSESLNNSEDVLYLQCDNDKCKAIYSTVSFIGNKGINVTAVFDNKLGDHGKCTVCNNGLLRVLTGVYAYDDGISSLVDGPPETLSVFEQVNKLLKSIQDGGISQEEIIKKAEIISPVIGKISRQTANKINYKDWVNLIIALFSFLVAIQQAYFKKEDRPAEYSGIKPEYVEMLINENNEMRAQQQAKAAVAKVHKPEKQQPAKSTLQPGRNTSCPCGSGKKFKRCHGAQ